jgi:hypothetical protein
VTAKYTLQLAQTESVFLIHVVWLETQPFFLQLEQLKQVPAPVFLLKYAGIVSRKQWSQLCSDTRGVSGRVFNGSS